MERDELTEIFARNLESMMASKGTNAAELARRAGLNPTAVYDILSGKSQSPRLDTIHKLARGLDAPPASLLEEPGLAEKRTRIVDIFFRLPTPERERLLLTAEAWLTHSATG